MKSLFRGHLFLALAAAALTAFAALSFATAPDDEALLRIAHQGEEPRSFRAVNALVMRGYFASKPRRVAQELIGRMPENVRRYVANEQPWHYIGQD